MVKSSIKVNKWVLSLWMLVIFLYGGQYYISQAWTESQLSECDVCIGEACWTAEIARRPKELERGLQFREELPEDRGMLFIFEQPHKAQFWMKDTLIPLDIIWIDQGSQIVHIEKNVQPCQSVVCPSYGPPTEAEYVLEIPAGLTEKMEIKLGDIVTLDVCLMK